MEDVKVDNCVHECRVIMCAELKWWDVYRKPWQIPYHLTWLRCTECSKDWVELTNVNIEIARALFGG